MIGFTQPVAVLLVAIVHFITDAEDPAGIVATLREALAPGSFLVLSHATADFHPPGALGPAVAVYQNAAAPFVPRGLGEIRGFFDGLDFVEQGLVQAPLWHPDGARPRSRDLAKIAIYAGVGRKAPASPLLRLGRELHKDRCAARDDRLPAEGVTADGMQLLDLNRRPGTGASLTGNLAKLANGPQAAAEDHESSERGSRWLHTRP
jgi:hypothetical protein